MPVYLKQAVAAVVLAGLVVAVLLLRQQPAEPPGDGKAADVEESLRRYGFHLREVSKEAGIDFTHQVPTLDAKLEHIMPIIASAPASAFPVPPEA